MELNGVEKRLIEECQKEESSWSGWAWLFLGTGVLLLGGGFLLMGVGANFSNPRDGVGVGQTAFVFFLLSLYFLDTGVHDRRERKLRRLLLKFTEAQVGTK